MNKKIIYISGGENVSAIEVRNAMEEVRTTLGLGADVVLFGVPVDAEVAPMAEVADEKPKKTRVKKVAEPVITDVVTDIVENEEIAPTVASAPIVPILSVLSVKSDVADDIAVPVQIDTVSIEDSIADDDDFMTAPIAATPVINSEESLEQLLEKIAPLREAEVTPDTTTPTPDDAPEISDIDSVLGQLATEFVQKQDEINVDAKITSGGKIGKLKNILPFKKSKREDTGLMGDLFGWAGIAANDDDFSMPGFFAKA